jgi:hypothetical protein
MHQLTQTLSPTLLNETAFLYSGNTIHLTPVGVFAQPSGWTGTTFFPAADNRLSRMPEIQLGAPYGRNWSSSYMADSSIEKRVKNRDFSILFRSRLDFRLTKRHS